MAEDNIFNSIPKFDPQLPPPEINFLEYEKVVQSRRSVRIFTDETIPHAITEKVLDQALLAPNSSNLQTWEFYRITTQTIRTQVVKACFSQNAAKTAQELIVCVARPSNYRRNTQQMMQIIDQFYSGKTPDSIKAYYSKLAPLIYWQGPFGIAGFLKRIIFFFLGFFRPVPRNPMSLSDMKLWAAKSVALACENIMLSYRAYGYDSCPMEGFDEVRLRKAVGYGRNAFTVMVIAAGKRAENGVYGPQIRLPKSQFLFEV